MHRNIDRFRNASCNYPTGPHGVSFPTSHLTGVRSLLSPNTSTISYPSVRRTGHRRQPDWTRPDRVSIHACIMYVRYYFGQSASRQISRCPLAPDPSFHHRGAPLPSRSATAAELHSATASPVESCLHTAVLGYCKLIHEDADIGTRSNVWPLYRHSPAFPRYSLRAVARVTAGGSQQ